MSKEKLRYNERSWAIDIISSINLLMDDSKDPIQKAGGEFSLPTAKNTLFPDILLFANQSSGSILQGWELKMPDTSISDPEFYKNAELKARTLGLNSFLLWNATIAHLYIYNNKIDKFELFEEPLFYDERIKTRDDVYYHSEIWRIGLKEILIKLNRFFDGGKISGVSPDVLFSKNEIIEQLLLCQSDVKEFLEKKCKIDHIVNARIQTWWKQVENEYPGEYSPYHTLAYCIILRWFNRFIFSNIAKTYYGSIKEVEKIDKTTSLEEALSLFSELGQKSGNWSVIGLNNFDSLIPENVWNIIASFNSFLQEFEFESIDKNILQSILKAAVLTSMKKIAGLYVTPSNVARLLVLLTLKDKTSHVIDPFCGTGTIFKTILDIKSEFNITGNEIVNTTWGSDKFAFPIQVATIAVSTPENMKKPLHIFTYDAFKLETGNSIPLVDPANSERIELKIPKFGSIISNLPFVQFEDIEELNITVKKKINDFYIRYGIKKEMRISGKSDLYAYIPFLLYDILTDDGTFGMIVSNSWLSTKWGKSYQKLLFHFYDVQYIITSACGRWFEESDIITNLIICCKSKERKNIAFIATNTKINDDDEINDLVNDILLEKKESNLANINIMTENDVSVVEKCKLGFNFCFSGTKRVLSLIPGFKLLSNYADIARGERRGWDKMFYPANEFLESIENEFLKPVLKTAKGHFSLLATEDSKAFCCSISKEQLKKENKMGAINWIIRFEMQNNKKGKPLPIALKRAKLFWYQMNADTLADITISLNPDSRIFFQKFENPTFVNQRLIRISVNNKSDIDILHALLNSTISMFFVESIGFGRGLGVLDINSTNIKNALRLPDITLLTPVAKNNILQKFIPLLKRDALPIQEELIRSDRNEFDKEIFKQFKLPLNILTEVYSGLKQLYNIRKSINK